MTLAISDALDATAATALIARIERRERLRPADGRALFDLDLIALGRLADEERQRRHPGNVVTFIKDRILNYTNVCITDCQFCAFYRRPKHPEAYHLPLDEILDKIGQTVEMGGTQVLIQGGHHPYLKIEYFEDLFRAIKQRYRITVHSLSAPEIDHIAKVSKISIREALERLHAAGLDSLPGGGAEILVDRVRKEISPKKVSADRWFEVHETAHAMGLRSTATMVFGLGETLEERIEHLERVRDLQDRTGGFRAFIPWSFTPYRSEMEASSDAPGGVDYLTTMAVARLYLDNIRDLHCGWLTEGRKLAQMALRFGANDLGGILMGEKVIEATGVDFQMSVNNVLSMIRGAGFTPAQRDTTYAVLRVYGPDEWD
ncbi:MAG: dehypoxanthine futalosine cyclase [Proteobacteria bacterium]|nr:dehypoxanthine futalosine cyclase [Pseudomonadota bacterium]